MKYILISDTGSEDSNGIGVQVNTKALITDNDIVSFGTSISAVGNDVRMTNNKANAPIEISGNGAVGTGNAIDTQQGVAAYITGSNAVLTDNNLNAKGASGNDAVVNNGTGNTIANNKANPKLDIGSLADVFEGQGVVIVITAEANFTDAVMLQVANNNYTVKVTNGTGSYEVSADSLSVGEVLVKVSFAGNEKYSNGTANVTFAVKPKVATAIKATAVTTTYGTSKNIVVTLTDANGNALVNQKVTVTLNGAKKVLTTNAKGQASYAIGTKLAPKTYTASISFAGDVSHIKSAGSAKVVVKKAKAKLTAKNKAFKVKKAKKYSIVLKTDKGKALKKAKVTITVKAKGKTVKVTVKTNSKGKATFNLKKLTKKGKFTATVKFAGNKYYNAASKKVKITIKK